LILQKEVNELGAWVILSTISIMEIFTRRRNNAGFV